MLNHVKLLLLEDEPLIRLLLSSKLAEAGAIVNEVEYCSQAVDIIHKTSFDICVFDYRLPDGNSMDVVDKMRVENCMTPVILLTGESTHITDEEIEKFNISAVLPKPPDADQIIATAKEVLSQTRNQNKTSRIGKYLIWNPAESEASLEEMRKEMYLVVDLSTSSFSNYQDVVEQIIQYEGAAAVVGADENIQENLRKINKNLFFTNNLDELAAISRRRSLPSERTALLESVVRKV